jgi:hypothetical protein
MMKRLQKRDISVNPARHGVRKLTHTGQRERGLSYTKGLVPLFGASARVYLSRLLRIAPKLSTTTTHARIVRRIAATWS